VSDIGPIFGPFDVAMLALIIGAPGLVLGAAGGAFVWRPHHVLGVPTGAVGGLLMWLVGFVHWKVSSWG